MATEVTNIANARWGYIFMQTGMRGNKRHAMGVHVDIATVAMAMSTYMPYKAMLCCVHSGMIIKFIPWLT